VIPFRRRSRSRRWRRIRMPGSATPVWSLAGS
jgi:hypothetical protein